MSGEEGVEECLAAMHPLASARTSVAQRTSQHLETRRVAILKDSPSRSQSTQTVRDERWVKENPRNQNRVWISTSRIHQHH